MHEIRSSGTDRESAIAGNLQDRRVTVPIRESQCAHRPGKNAGDLNERHIHKRVEQQSPIEPCANRRQEIPANNPKTHETSIPPAMPKSTTAENTPEKLLNSGSRLDSRKTTNVCGRSSNSLRKASPKDRHSVYPGQYETARPT